MPTLFFVFLKVMGFPSNKTAAEKSYVSALCRILVLLHFRLSEQGPIKLMRQLLSCIAQSVVAERELLKELKEMASRLKAADRSPDQQLSSDQANHIFGNKFILFSHLIKESAFSR